MLETLRASQSQSNVSISDIVGEVLFEQQDRESRKLNVVCFGLNESVGDSPETRKADDKDRIEEVVHNVMSLQDVQTSELIRLGRYEEGRSRPRPIKFTVESVAIKQKIIEKSRTLVKDSRLEICRNLFFQSDLTKKQREEEYKRRVERRSRNDQRLRDLNSLRDSQSRTLPQRSMIPQPTSTMLLSGSQRPHTGGAASSSGSQFRV